jgi:H+/gluconate symporter-like permease
MKTILNKQISTLKMLAVALIILIFSSCTKETSHCQEWEVTDERSVYGSCQIDLCGGSTGTFNLVFCGDGLKDAKPGNTVVISDDRCCRLIRTFKRLVQSLS